MMVMRVVGAVDGRVCVRACCVRVRVGVVCQGAHALELGAGCARAAALARQCGPARAGRGVELLVFSTNRRVSLVLRCAALGLG